MNYNRCSGCGDTHDAYEMCLKKPAPASSGNSDLLMGNWFDKGTLPPPSSENRLRSIKVITDEGDAAYYSYGYKRWDWWAAVDFEQEPHYPVFKQWTPFFGPDAH